MREDLQALYNKISGRQVFVVGGGPSVKTQDLSLLKNKNIIAINNSYKLFDDVTALFWADESWAGNHYDALLKYPCKLRFHSKFHASKQYLAGDIKGVAGCTVLKRSGESGLDHDIDSVRGNNSGAQVLNLLHNMKAREIVLLGYDMKVSGGNSHWHSGHGLPIRPDVYWNFISCINTMAPLLAESKIKVINTCLNSDLKCFPIKHLKDCV